MDYSKTNATKTSSTKTGSTKSGKSSQSKVTVDNSVKKKSSSTVKKTGGTGKKTSKESLVSDVLGQIITTQYGNNSGKKKTYSKSNSKSRSRRNSAVPLFLGIVLFLGALCGFFAMKVLCKNDVYEMVAYQDNGVDVVIKNTSDKEYEELGVKCVAFGKDYSDKVDVKYYYRNSLSDDVVEVDFVDKEKDGIYYAEYFSPSAKYKLVKLIRKITVLMEEDNVE